MLSCRLSCRARSEYKETRFGGENRTQPGSLGSRRGLQYGPRGGADAAFPFRRIPASYSRGRLRGHCRRQRIKSSIRSQRNRCSRRKLPLGHIDPAQASPVQAVNRGIAEARGKVIGVMIDGARMVTPGLLHFARHGAAMYDRAVVASIGWFLGCDDQRWYPVRRCHSRTGGF